MSDDDPLVWKKIASEPGPELALFKVRFDTLRHPVSDAEFKRLVLEAPDWVTVVAVTPDEQVLMVEQFRFGVGALTLEPVAGLIDPGETSLDAARRELLEETGYRAARWRSLGAVQANPAYHDNLCHLWLAEDAQRVQPPSPDEGEAMRVHLMSVEQLRSAVTAGEILHPLGLAALSRVFPLWDCPFVADASPRSHQR